LFFFTCEVIFVPHLAVDCSDDTCCVTLFLHIPVLVCVPEPQYAEHGEYGVYTHVHDSVLQQFVQLVTFGCNDSQLESAT
jgi:hypothetical protein